MDINKKGNFGLEGEIKGIDIKKPNVELEGEIKGINVKKRNLEIGGEIKGIDVKKPKIEIGKGFELTGVIPGTKTNKIIHHEIFWKRNHHHNLAVTDAWHLWSRIHESGASWLPRRSKCVPCR